MSLSVKDWLPDRSSFPTTFLSRRPPSSSLRSPPGVETGVRGRRGAGLEVGATRGRARLHLGDGREPNTFPVTRVPRPTLRPPGTSVVVYVPSSHPLRSTRGPPTSGFRYARNTNATSSRSSSTASPRLQRAPYDPVLLRPHSSRTPRPRAPPSLPFRPPTNAPLVAEQEEHLVRVQDPRRPDAPAPVGLTVPTPARPGRVPQSHASRGQPGTGSATLRAPFGPRSRRQTTTSILVPPPLPRGCQRAPQVGGLAPEGREWVSRGRDGSGDWSVRWSVR